MQMNWKQETSKSGTVYPTGTYLVRIVSHERVAASTGTPQIRWRAEIIAPDEHKGRSILEHTALTEPALWRLANFVASCGVDTSDCGVMDINSGVFDRTLDACKERTVYWHVVEETGQNGKQRNKINDYQQDATQSVIKPSNEDIAWS